MTTTHLNCGLPQPLSSEQYEAHLDLSRLSTMHRVVPMTTSSFSR
jgi:hypothetical protein